MNPQKTAQPVQGWAKKSKNLIGTLYCEKFA